MYAENWLGEDRSRNMSPLAGVGRAGMRLALHSDAPMAPLSPLTLVWAAVNRTTINGNQNAKTQAISVDEALKGCNNKWCLGDEKRRQYRLYSCR